MRFLFTLIYFLVACESERSTNDTYADIDSTRNSHVESFDLQVRKYEDPNRQGWQDPKFVIEALGDLTNLVIADIGAGTGYFTFQLAVPAKKVIAIDIEQRFLNYIEDRKSEMFNRALAKKIETRLTTPDQPSLKSEEADLVLMVNTVGYIDNRDRYMDVLIKGMANNGRIVIVDYNQGVMPVGPADQDKVTATEISAALDRAGFVVDSTDKKSLQYQYLLKAHKPFSQ